MSGIIRLQNDATGHSTVNTLATDDTTYTIPDVPGGGDARLLTTNAHGVDTAAGISWSGFPVTINNGDVNLNDGTLFVDESTNQVGIGTTTPGRPLHIDGNEGVVRFTSTASGNNGFEVGIGTSSQAFLWQTENAPMQFGTNNTLVAEIDASGLATFFNNIRLDGSGSPTRLIMDSDGHKSVWGSGGAGTDGIYLNADQNFSRNLGVHYTGATVISPPVAERFLIGTNCVSSSDGEIVEANVRIDINTSTGSADFAGTVETGFHGIGINNEGGGAINEAFAISSAPGNNVFTRKTTFYTDGKVVFTNNVEGAYFSANQDDGNSAVFRGRVGTPGAAPGGYTSIIYGSGNAVFGPDASKVAINQIGTNPRGSIGLYNTDPSSGASGIIFYTQGSVSGTISYDGNTLFYLEPDDPNNYVTTTDAEGNVSSVYNGPTLDVKDRLTKADTALKTLKTAAAAAADFAELKSAIATALADI